MSAVQFRAAGPTRPLPHSSGRLQEMVRPPSRDRELARLQKAQTTVAQLVVSDPVYAPIFERLDAEIATEEAKRMASDPISAARAIVAARRSLRRD